VSASGRTKGRFPGPAILGLVLAAVVGGGYALLAQPPDHDRLNFLQRCMVGAVVAKWEKEVEALPEEKRPLVDFGYLMGRLNFIEKMVVSRIFAIPPRELGFKGPFHTLEKPQRLVKISPANYRLNGQEKSTGSQYCPETSYNDYLKMMAQMRRDLGRELFIQSGYRSPGMQAYLFLYYLARKHHYSLQETARWVALPGYSEHGAPVNNALDFINRDGISGEEPGQTPEDFEGLPEYRWLLAHAHEFNFHLSYPRGNQLGISFEPWHWHWEKQPSSGEEIRTD
jgi:LAS superfamily LD-carboxypeptidase LdcB